MSSSIPISGPWPFAANRSSLTANRLPPERKGIQIGTIDALLAQLAIAHELEFLTADRDFNLMARRAPLRLLSEAT